MNYWIIFLTGLTTGGVSCLAMQGGLLASVIANQKDEELVSGKKTTAAKSFDLLDWLPVGLFLGSKLIAHIILGFLLGLVGSVVALSLPIRLLFQVMTALFMLATAMNLLEIHPIFRHMVLQPPKFIQRIVRSSTKSRALFAPAMLGLLTIFIPCGVTQAMEVAAVASGKPLVGAMTMGVFVLGTAPIFAMIGIATAKFSELWRERFLRVAAVSLILMAVYGLNGVLTVIDAPITAQKISRGIAEALLLSEPTANNQGAVVQNGVQKIKITITDRGYVPQRLQVKMGIPVELTVEAKNVYSCAASFTFRKFNIAAQFKPTETRVFKFTPQEKGKFTFSCSMGMYTGTLEVI